MAPATCLAFVAMLAVPEAVPAAERLSLDATLPSRLLALAPGKSTPLPAWPLEPGRRADVRLTRRDVYAPGAEIDVVDGSASRRAPRSTLVFLFGEVEGDEATRVLVSVDPATMRLSSYVRTPDGWTEMRPLDDRPDEYVLAPAEGFLAPGVEPPIFECEPEASGPPEEMPELPRRSAGVAQAATMREMTLAVDTDNELMSLKFADDTASAADYVASLVALMSVIYERDLSVRLLLGTTFLRVSTTPDPYLQSGTGNADSAKLTEFRDYWVANYAGVSRGAAMLLSGKQSSVSSASGIGYVNSLCSGTRGYTFSQVFKYSGSTASSDTKLVAHEVGHNFGSSHTHCYLTPTPIDTCYSGESGCYSGPTSCPAAQTINGVANVRGTLMSYCHLLSGCSSSSVFHPRTVELLNPIVDSKVGVCVFPASGSNPKEASPSGTMTAARGAAGSVSVTYAPACGATDHTVYAGTLDTLRTGGLTWGQRFCSLGSSGSLSFTPAGNVYFVVAGDNGTTEGSYGQATAGERPPAGPGGACSYTQDLSGACP
jgi:hypothetical protein